MGNDKMREEFEAWHKTEVANFVAAGEMQAARVLSEFKQTALAIWEASRAAVVVEPVWPYHHDYTNSDVAGAAILDCCIAFNKAARNAGLKVKP